MEITIYVSQGMVAALLGVLIALIVKTIIEYIPL